MKQQGDKGQKDHHYFLVSSSYPQPAALPPHRTPIHQSVSSFGVSVKRAERPQPHFNHLLSHLQGLTLSFFLKCIFPHLGMVLPCRVCLITPPYPGTAGSSGYTCASPIQASVTPNQNGRGRSLHPLRFNLLRPSHSLRPREQCRGCY